MKTTKIFFEQHTEKLIAENNFVKAIKILFESQLKEWKKLDEAYSELRFVKTKSFLLDDIKLNVQYNPQRIESTSAVTDDEHIKNRRCFLCEKNLPAEQKGINYKDKYLILCNPYPIFSEHLTIASFNHQPQNIFNSFEDLLNLAMHLSNAYSIIYNGARCGASAPDHLHFQAVTKYVLPVENDFDKLKSEYGKTISMGDEVLISFVNDYLRKMIFIESSVLEAVVKSFNITYNLLQEVTNTNDEPLINSVCSYDDKEGWKIILFLRSKHRPDAYFNQDENRLLVSPAAVDLSGILVTPREKDFNEIDESLIKNIFKEVSLDDNKFNLLKEALL